MELSDKTIVCRCEEITLGEIKDAIKDGATTVNGIKKRTRACMGMCQGRVCQPLLKRILAAGGNEKDRGRDIGTATFRAPARPVLLGDLAE